MEKKSFEEKMMNIVLIVFAANLVLFLFLTMLFFLGYLNYDAWTITVWAGRVILFVLLIAFFFLKYKIDKKLEQSFQERSFVSILIEETEKKIIKAKEHLKQTENKDKIISIQQNIDLLEKKKTELEKQRKID